MRSHWRLVSAITASEVSDIFGSFLFAVFVEPVGVDELCGGVGRVCLDRAQERGFVGHGQALPPVMTERHSAGNVCHAAM